MATLTLAHLRPLLEQFAGKGLVVSCYADLSTPTAWLTRWPMPFKAKVSEIKQILADDRPAWRECEQNLDAIGQALDTPEARTAQGMAIFSARQRGFLHALPLDVPVANELVVHPSPYLVPLLVALARQHDYLVIHSNTHRGRLYAAAAGVVRLLQEVEGDVPVKQHSVGQRWGKEQATIARRREECIAHYHKDLVEAAEKLWAEHAFRGILLLGEHETLEHIRKRLPARLASRIAHERPHAWPEKPLEVAGTVQAALADMQRGEEQRLLADLESRLRKGHAVAVGPRAVVEALQTGRLSPRGYGYVVLGPDSREVVARCTACRYLAAEMQTICPRCQAPTAEASLWEEVLLLALRNDLAVHCLDRPGILAPYDGIAAVLPEPDRAALETIHE